MNIADAKTLAATLRAEFDNYALQANVVGPVLFFDGGDELVALALADFGRREVLDRWDRFLVAHGIDDARWWPTEQAGAAVMA